jgi:cytochrome c oxidase subunit 6a
MTLLARSTRTAARTISRTRPYSVVVDAPSAEWVAKREAIKHHASGTFLSWAQKSELT